jgi:hypothetical protein
MGDRANIHIKEDVDDIGVYLYTHWRGSDLPEILKDALEKRWRWDDAPYLTRIIFDEMSNGNQGNETGFGISTMLGDGDDRIIKIIVDEQLIKINGRTWTFDEYIKDNPSW